MHETQATAKRDPDLGLDYRVLREHGAIRRLISQLRAASSGKHDVLAADLADRLLRHESAKRHTLYRAIRQDVPRGETIVSRLLDESIAIEDRARTLSTTTDRPTHVLEVLDDLEALFVAHARNEEHLAINQIRRHCSPTVLVEWGQRHLEAANPRSAVAPN